MITGTQKDSRFVPLVFNMFSDDSLYAKENSQLDELNQQIDSLNTDASFLKSFKQLLKLEKENELHLYNQRKKHAVLKAARKKEREQALSSFSEEEYQRLLDSHQT